ncbi:MAG TPA: DUF2088 domain-containing protein [Clostridiaceae bacterium]|nr:DUF2088 domain-containing protein [Clostridiaceae bacterium]
MKYTLPYGDKQLSFELPDDLPVSLLQLEEPAEESDTHDIVGEAIGSTCRAQLEPKIKPDSQIAIICDDVSRPTPAELILDQLLPVLADLGIPDEQIRIVFALGTHRRMTVAEIEQKIGSTYAGRFRICQPTYNQDSDFETALVTEKGEAIRLYHEVLSADIRIGIGDVVPCNVLGWSGGASIMFPGVASESSIANFQLKAALHPVPLFGEKENAIRDEVESWVERIGLDCIINTVLNRKSELVGCYAGHVVTAHRQAVEAAEAIYGTSFAEQADLVIANGEPSSFDFWQGTKGLNASNIVASDGADVILCIPCPEGVGPHPEYLDFLGRENPEDILAAYIDEPSAACDPIAMAVGTMIAKRRARYRIHLLSDGISHDECHRAGIRKIDDLQTAIDHLLHMRRIERAAIIRDGAKILPRKPD